MPHPGDREEINRTAPTVGVVAICRNEEANLPGLFACTRWADEVIIIDDGSDDRSAEIAAAEGPRVLFEERRMVPDEGYAGQRNAGIALARADWLIHMDCDERITPELADEIRNAIHDPDLYALRYTRQNYFLNRPMRGGGWTTWNRPQIARRGRHKFVGRVHEACDIEGGDARTGQLRALMPHLNEDGFEHRIRKSTRYVEMTADQLQEQGVTASGRSMLLRMVRTLFGRYVLKKGYRDGTPGVISAMHSALADFNTHALLWCRQNGRTPLIPSPEEAHAGADRLAQAGSVNATNVLFRPVSAFFRALRHDAQPSRLIAAGVAATTAFRANALAWDRQNPVSRAEVEADLRRRWDAVDGGPDTPSA